MILKRLLIIFFLTLFLYSCEKSMEEEAKEAAQLTRLSLEKSEEGNLEESEKYFIQSKKIFDKYRNKQEFFEFDRLYNKYLENPTEE